MMKFVKHHLESITGIEIYPLISLCIFFLFFIGLIAYVIRMNKSYISKMEAMPVMDESQSDQS